MGYEIQIVHEPLYPGDPLPYYGIARDRATGRAVRMSGDHATEEEARGELMEREKEKE